MKWPAKVLLSPRNTTRWPSRSRNLSSARASGPTAVSKQIAIKKRTITFLRLRYPFIVSRPPRVSGRETVNGWLIELSVVNEVAGRRQILVDSRPDGGQ